MQTPELASLPEESIRTRAYLLWEADGRPHSRDDHYWCEAIAQLKREALPQAESSLAEAIPTSKTRKAKKAVVADEKHADVEAAIKPKPSRARKAKVAADEKPAKTKEGAVTDAKPAKKTKKTANDADVPPKSASKRSSRT